MTNNIWRLQWSLSHLSRLIGAFTSSMSWNRCTRSLRRKRILPLKALALGLSLLRVGRPIPSKSFQFTRCRKRSLLIITSGTNGNQLFSFGGSGTVTPRSWTKISWSMLLCCRRSATIGTSGGRHSKCVCGNANIIAIPRSHPHIKKNILK